MNINLVSYVVRDALGNMDLAATENKFHEDLVKYQAKNEVDTEVIGNAVKQLFDKYPGANIQMKALITFTLQILQTKVDAMELVSSRIHKYVQANAGEGKLFEIKNGAAGGVKRL